ncbi:MAG: Mitochondrial outer membrane protein iml2 [Alectoria fallacina]|uniref:Inclusion body clearance protein IML2 n=1 Tax=Alectoria fallacina TaxID=1903189 RepID=A0A8H3FK18_9LECA|nr:MAG: Mitochondrial outer membrane protein iml2 [Alectoria fallacina]
MNDDLESAEAGLTNGISSFHKLAKGMVAFLRATLGFEPEIMREAAERLSDADTTASTDHRRAQKDSNSYRSAIYPPGAEFALCHAQTQLMSAVIGVLNESLTESIRGFYKLRKAYVTLDGILDAEARYMKNRSGMGTNTASRTSVESFRSDRSAPSMKGVPGGFGGATSKPPSIRSFQLPIPKSLNDSGAKQDENTNGAQDDDEEDEFYDADDGMTAKLDNLSIEDEGTLSAKDLPTFKTPAARHGLLDHDPDSDVFANPIDVFIHSGANLCFGLLLVMIAMIPPAFGKLLFIIGFHGDKDRGIRMLWQASKFHNINGAMAGLIVLGYYNTFIGMSDIIPDSDPTSIDQNTIEGYPKQRCEALLAEMRRRHPKSGLWLLEEARMQAANRHLSTAVSILEKSPKSSLKQVEALEMFEKSLDAMYMHDYALCSKSFIACVDLNNWSHTLYYYIAGAANVEMYRQHRTLNPTEAAVYAKKATELLKLAPKHAGKKKFMARQLPFDIFVTRKIQKWESRARDWSVPFIDAVGVSPVEEMVFLWNGYKRMDTSQLEQSLSRLSWSETSNLHWKREGPDEKALLSLLYCTTLRNLQRYEEAKKSLRSGVLSYDKNELKGGLKDDWTAPAANYEMGVNCWMQRGEARKEGKEAEVKKWVKECESWIEKAAGWEKYELDARIGLKIATAQDTLKRWHEKEGTAK